MIAGWTALILAGILEVGFTTAMKLSEGFSRGIWVVAFGVSAVGSFWFLTVAMRTIPLGTAYAVWTGIGAFGTAIIGIVFYGDSGNALRLMFLFLLIGSIVGLKFVSHEGAN